MHCVTVGVAFNCNAKWSMGRCEW